MSAPRFFFDGSLGPGVEVTLDPEDAHHALHVLRLGAGASVVLIAGEVAWDAELLSSGGASLRARVVGKRDSEAAELPVDVSVLQAIVKGNKFDEVVEKCVELGVRRIVPVICSRSYADATPSRLGRWRRIARAAAQQSRRTILPVVEEPLPWAQAVRGAPPLLVAWEGASSGSLSRVLEGLGDRRELRIAVGPEGSYTEEELDVARACGAHFVSLGPTILRTETAASALLAAIASRHW